MSTPVGDSRGWTRRSGPSTCAGWQASCPRGHFVHWPDGSHLAWVDDHDVYVAGLVEFPGDLEATP